MTQPPASLLTYMQGLKAHDIKMIGSSLLDELKFVTPVRTMDKRETLEFLTALYQGFPGWHYDNDPPVAYSNGSWGVRWQQGGIHTGTLALPGFPAVPSTNRVVHIPKQFFYYRVTDQGMLEIRPDPIPNGAPRAIFEQIGVKLPPL